MLILFAIIVPLAIVRAGLWWTSRRIEQDAGRVALALDQARCVLEQARQLAHVPRHADDERAARQSRRSNRYRPAA